MDLQLSARAGRACTVVAVGGELDVDTAAELHDFLQVRLRPRYLYLGVFDDADTQPILRSERPADTPGGRGLHLVELTATRWGHQRQHHGKVVWACFDTSPNA